MSTSEDTEIVTGKISYISFRSEENGYTVLKVECQTTGKIIPVVGMMQPVREDDLIECHGEWVKDPKWGLQFQTYLVRLRQPTSLEGIIKYLSSGSVYGIGPVLATRLVDAFGTHTFEVLEHHPERILKLPDIGPKRAKSIIENFKAQRAVADIMSFLLEHGLGTVRAYRIYKTYGDQAVSIIKSNPYILSSEIQGVSFRTADDIARKIGICPYSEVRIKAGLQFELGKSAREGHCATIRSRLINGCAKTLNVPVVLIEEALDQEVADRNLVTTEIGDIKAVYFPKFYYAEINVSRHLKRIIADLSVSVTDHSSAHMLATTATYLLGNETNVDQIRGAQQALTSKVSILTGLPGTGKTTTLRAVILALEALGKKMGLVAPTGRASKRMKEMTGKDSQTMHRFLGVDMVNGGFNYNEDNQVDLDYLIIDESSMVDICLAAAILAALPDHCCILIVGDTDQLPSVMPGNFLYDLISSGIIPVCRLTDIYRQARNSHIILNAHLVNQGRPFSEFYLAKEGVESDFIFRHAESPQDVQREILKLVDELPSQFGFDPINDIQILTPSHKHETGTRELNILLQQKLNPHRGPEVNSFGYKFGIGDKVMQMKNDYNKMAFNGDIGRIENIISTDKLVQISYENELKEYDFPEMDIVSPAWGATIHKSQGSEYPCVILVVTKQHYIMLERCLLFTGMTRAQKLLAVVGQPEAMDIAIRNVRSRERLTNLSYLLAA